MSPLRARKWGGEEAFGDILMPLMWEVGIGVCPPQICYKNCVGCPRFLSSRRERDGRPDIIAICDGRGSDWSEDNMRMYEYEDI